MKVCAPGLLLLAMWGLAACSDNRSLGADLPSISGESQTAYQGTVGGGNFTDNSPPADNGNQASHTDTNRVVNTNNTVSPNAISTYVSSSAYGIINFAVAANNTLTSLAFNMIVPAQPSATGTLYVTGQTLPRDANAPSYQPIQTGYLGPALVWGPSCLPMSHPADYTTWWVTAGYFNYQGNVANHTGCTGGNTMAVAVGDTLAVTMALSGTQWQTTITDTRTVQSVNYTLDMLGQAQSGIILGINPLGVAPLGDVLFENIVFTVANSDPNACVSTWIGANDYVATGVASSDMRTCRVSKAIARAQGVPATTPNR